MVLRCDCAMIMRSVLTWPYCGGGVCTQTAQEALSRRKLLLLPWVNSTKNHLKSPLRPCQQGELLSLDCPCVFIFQVAPYTHKCTLHHTNCVHSGVCSTGRALWLLWSPHSVLNRESKLCTCSQGLVPQEGSAEHASKQL